MKKIKIIVLSFTVLAVIIVVSAFAKNPSSSPESKVVTVQKSSQNQMINLFVTHGHCSTPFIGRVDSLKVVTQTREHQGNPLEGMKISFQIDPESFNVCASEDLTARIKTPGLFIGENDERITFRSTQVYTMGLDWYQVNGKMSIKGVERDVKFFVSGIRDSNHSMASSLVLEGQVNLQDWGIDYDLIVNGESGVVAAKWMHLNMKIKMG